MTIDEMRKEFESRFVVHPSLGDRSPAPTGEKYTELMSGFIPTIGRNPPLYQDEASCIEALLETLTKYAIGKTGTLYWRIPPEVGFEIYKLDPSRGWMGPELKIWKGYARLLISDKPVLAGETSAA